MVLAVLMTGLSVAWYARTAQKETEAKEARIAGLAAAEEGDWPLALRKLSRAVAQDKSDFEALLVFAEARSRVPEVNNRHLATSMNLFDRACDLGRSNGVEPEKLRTALSGLARMELANNAIARLLATSRELLEIDPENTDALNYLYGISRARSNFLPSFSREDQQRLDMSFKEAEDLELSLLRRGKRTDLEWISAMRKYDDDSALRWALENVVIDPGSMEQRQKLISVLREGGSVDLQIGRTGDRDGTETPLKLAQLWLEDAGEHLGMLHVLLAYEYLQEDNRAECESNLEKAEALGFDRPEPMLMAMRLRESLGDPASLQLARKLLQDAEQIAMADPGVAIQIADKYWNEGRSGKAMSLLARARENGDDYDRIRIAARGMMLLALDRSDSVDDQIVVVGGLLDSGDVPAEYRDLIREVVKLVGISRIDNPDQEDILEALSFSSASQDPLIQALFGDILAKAGFTQLAIDSWKKAAQYSRYQSVPIGSRLIRGLLRSQYVDQAFEEAVKFVSATKSTVLAARLAEAWMLLNAAGIDPKDVVPQFTGWESPLELLKMCQEVMQDDNFILPLLLKAGLVEDREDVIEEVIARATDEENPLGVSMLLNVARMLSESGDDSAPLVLKRIKSMDEYESYRNSVAVTEAAMLRRMGRPAEALALIEDLVIDNDEESVILLGLERLEYDLAVEQDTAASLDAMLAFDLDLPMFKRLHQIALLSGNAEVSNRYVDKAFSQFGVTSAAYVAAFANNALAFEDPETDKGGSAIRSAIVLADPLVDARRADAELQLALVNLLLASNPPQITRAIEVLGIMTQEMPGRFDLAIQYIELLQRDGRFDEANDELRRLSERRDSAPDGIRRRIPLLLAGQGDLSKVKDSLCELAEETGLARDLLACAKACLAAGDSDRGDSILTDLLLDPERSAEVDITVASRLATKGSGSEAVQLLEDSQVFPSDIRKDIALASLVLGLMETAKQPEGKAAWWQRLTEVLAGWDPDDELDATKTSAKALADLEVIRAMSHLKGPKHTRDPAKANAALLRAVQLAPQSAGILNRNVTIRLADADLKDTAVDAIERLAEVEPDQAGLSRLLYDLEYSSDPAASDIGNLVERARIVVDGNPRDKVAYSLAIDIYGKALNQAIIDADMPMVDRRSQELLDLCELAVSRFPSDQRFPVILSRIHQMEGDLGTALSSAREGQRRAGEAANISNAMPIAAIEMKMGNFRGVVDVLAPYRDLMEAKPTAVPAGTRLLLQALICSGQVDAAWSFFQIARRNGGLSIQDWYVGIESASPSIAMQAALRSMPESDPGPERLPLIGALLAVQRKNPNPTLRSMIAEQLDVLQDSGSSANLTRIQVALLTMSLDDDTEPISVVRRYVELMKSIPPGFVSKLESIAALSEEEFQKQRIDLEPVLKYRNITVMIMNNGAAVAADAVLRGGLDGNRSEKQELMEIAGDYANVLAKLVPAAPEVLDTRAMVSMMQGDDMKAVELARAAVDTAPMNPGFRFTLAKAMRENGMGARAVEQAKLALRILRGESSTNLEVVEELESFIKQGRG